MITVPVSCCVQDVFSGVWSWVGDDELHYTKDNSDLRSGAKDALHGGFNRAGVHVDHHRCVNDTLHFDVPSSAPASEQCMLNGGMALALVDSGSDTDLALGEIGANDAFVATSSRRRVRRVHFNPEVEVCEFEPHFDFMAVDDVLPSTDSCSGDGTVQFHFASEADDILPPPFVGDMDVDHPAVEEDVEDDAYVVFHGFGVLEASTTGMTISPDAPLRVITYGIHGVSLGRRDTWVTTAELHHLKQRLWELWEDVVPQFAPCWAFAVRPQPLIELQVTRAWVILVEIDPSTATPPGFCAALLLMCNEQGTMFGRPRPKLVREDTTTEAMVFQHPHSQVCIPDGMRECKLMVEGSLQAPQAEVHVRPGALSKLLIADAAPAIQQALFWYPDAEQMAVEALALQRGGLDIFQLVLHEADRSPREFDVGISALTTPMTLRSLLPADLRHSRLYWIPLRSLHPSLGVWRGRFHLVVGATTPGPTRPLMVVTCRATESYCELWHHAVWWMPHGISLPDFVSIVFSDLDEQARSGIIVCHNQVPIDSVDGLGAGSVVTLYHGRSMSSEGYEIAEEDDDTSLMQARAHGAGDPSQDYDPSTFSAHVVLQNLAPIWRGRGPARDVFQRRSLYLLNHDLPAHQLFSWARLATPLWNGEYYEVDVLIQYPRPLEAVDIVVEFVDMALRQRLEEPVIFRVLVPLTSWALSWSLQQHFHYEFDWQVGDPMVNGYRWGGDAGTRQFYDGDVVTIFLQDGASVNDVCVVTPSSTSDDLSGSERATVELQVVTILQSGDRGEDQRFDMLAPWHESPMETLQLCIANPLVGWALPCRSFRRWSWQHRRQVLALAWTDLLDPHTVPVLVVETVIGSDIREWHIAYLPVQLRPDDVQFWAHRSGPCEIMDQWRHAHPTIPDRLTFAVGSQLWLRFPAVARPEDATGLQLLQVKVKRSRSSDDGALHTSFDPDLVLPDASAPSLNYSEDNSDLSSGCSLGSNDDHNMLDFTFLDSSQVIPCPSEVSDSLSTSTTTFGSRPYSTRYLPDGSSWVDYTEANMDLSSGSACHDPRGDVASLPATNALRDPRLDSLHVILDALAQPWPHGSFATDYQAIPNLHPIAAMICADQDWVPISGSGVRFHLYTDGSAKLTPSPVAAWAFQVLLESLGPWGVQFHRIGYTGAVLGADVPEAQIDALDAEALALIFAADWLLSLPQSVGCVLHFDALAAGCGAYGAQNEPAPAMCPRPVQHYARCVLSMAQAKHVSLRWAHVQAHTGQPDNEVADSIAYALVSGWVLLVVRLFVCGACLNIPCAIGRGWNTDRQLSCLIWRLFLLLHRARLRLIPLFGHLDLPPMFLM